MNEVVKTIKTKLDLLGLKTPKIPINEYIPPLITVFSSFNVCRTEKFVLAVKAFQEICNIDPTGHLDKNGYQLLQVHSSP